MIKRLCQAQDYYSPVGFADVEAPWAVSQEIMDITAPAGSVLFPFLNKLLVASGEQSFLQMVFDCRLPQGRWQCTTPCFRDDKPDELHHNYFMKLELIDTGDTSHYSLADMLQKCHAFFSRYVKCRVESVVQPSLLDLPNCSYDVVSAEGIELGSYGIRYHPLVGHWVYGTGCAEPRLSYVAQQQRKLE